MSYALKIPGLTGNDDEYIMVNLDKNKTEYACVNL
jgi:hypothetical protein